MNPLIAALLSSLRHDAKANPAKALADIKALLALVSGSPQALQLLVAGLPAKERAIITADPEGAIAALQAEIPVLEKYPKLFQAILLAVA